MPVHIPKQDKKTAAKKSLSGSVRRAVKRKKKKTSKK